MIKTDSNFKWTKERNDTFDKIEEDIAEVPTLNFDKEFILYTFAFDHSIVAVLTQNNELGEEFSVYFMSIGLQGENINYPTINKQYFAVFKDLKHF